MSEDGFRVDTPEQAAWAMRKYRGLAQKRERHISLADKERARIDAWEQRVVSMVDSQLEFYAAHLEGYAMRERARGAKSLEFPDGAIKTRQAGPSFEVDRGVFIEWANEAKRDDLLRVSYAPDMTAIKASVIVDSGTVLDPASGEVIPGLAPIPERVSVKIEPDLTAVDLDELDEGFDDVDE
jgi:hypothetical protein